MWYNATLKVSYLFFSELETSVENLRSHVINKKTRVSMADVEQLATLLSRSRLIETLRLSARTETKNLILRCPSFTFSCV